MKNLKFIFLVIASLLYTYSGKAQDDDIQFTVTNASASGVCDGAMDIQCTGCSPMTTYTWYTFQNNQAVVIGTGNNITGLCENDTNLYFVQIEGNGYGRSAFHGKIQVASVAGATFQTNTLLHRWDGTYYSEYMDVKTVTGGVPPYNYTLYDNNSNIFFVGGPGTTDYLLLADSNLTQINNLRFDSVLSDNPSYNYYYTFFLRDSKDNLIEYYFSPDSSSLNPGPNPLWLSAQGYPVSDSAVCDGKGYAIAYGGTPPYTYSFSSGATDSVESGLCPGYYLVTVTDSQSNSYNSTFIVGYPGTIYFTDPYSLTYLDTLYSNAAQNCGLDYSIPVDTCYWDTSYVLSAWEYVVKWVVVQDTNKYKFTQIYHIDSTGNYMFGLSVYCNQRSSTFGSFSFFTGLHVNMPTVTGISVLKEETNSMLYPNPSNGIYRLTAASLIKQYKIYDQLGRKVVEKTVYSKDEIINITEVKSGMYYLHIQYENGAIYIQKLLKN